MIDWNFGKTRLGEAMAMRKQHPKTSSKAGFTLIELMITVVVFTGGMVAILGSSVSMYRQQQFADYESLSAQWANLILVELQDDVVKDGISAAEDGEVLDITDLTSHESGLVATDGSPTNLFGGNPVPFQLDGLGAIATVELENLTNDNPCEVQITINVFPNGNTDGAIQLSYVTSRYITF